MTILEQYNRAYRNYRARVRYLQARGYQIKPIKKVKRPKRASIFRLEKQTSKVMKEHATAIDLETGEVIETFTKSSRKSLEKKNLAITHPKKTESKKGRQPQVATTFIPHQWQVILERFEQSFNDFLPWIKDFVVDEYRRITSTRADAIRLALAIKENPDYIPSPADSRIEIISYKYNVLESILSGFTPEYILRQFQDIVDVEEVE